jgi:hypothetical protein
VEDAELSLRIGVDTGNRIPHRLVEVGDSNGWRLRANLLPYSVDRIHEPVKALLPLMVDEAECAAENLAHTVNGHDLEEGEAFVVGSVGVVI